GTAMGNEWRRELAQCRYRSFLRRTYLGRAALDGIEKSERRGLIAPRYGSDDTVDGISVPVSPFHVRPECAEVIVVAPLLDLQPSSADVGDIARWRLLVV